MVLLHGPLHKDDIAHFVLLLQGGSRIEKGAADRSFALAAKNYVTRLFNPPKVSHLAAFTSATAV